MKKLMQNRLLLGILCLLVAVLLAWGLAPAISRSAAQETNIFVAKEGIPKGTQISEDDLILAAVPRKYVPDGALTAAPDIIGKYAASNIPSGDYFFSVQLAAKPTVENEWAVNADENHLAISVTIKSFADGLSAKLEPGDIVSLIAVDSSIATDMTSVSAAYIPPELQYVKVLAVTADTAADYDPQENDDSNASSDENKLPATITVLATPTQAVTLADCEINGTLHAALVCRGDEKKAETLLQMQTDILTTMPSASEPEGGDTIG